MKSQTQSSNAVDVKRSVMQERADRRAARTPDEPLKVVIVGGGITGITIASELVAVGLKPVVYEDRAPDKSVSYLAGGLIEPVAGTLDEAGAAREQELFAASYPIWSAYSDTIGLPFVRETAVYNYSSGGRAPLPWASAVRDFEQVAADALHPAYAGGEAVRFTSYVVDAPRWLAAERQRLIARGVVFERRHVETLDEIRDADVVVNATGIGAYALCGDRTVYAGDGHVICLERAPGVDTVFIDESHASNGVDDEMNCNMLYAIPRTYDVVVGGTLWNRPDADVDPVPIDGMAAHLRQLISAIEPRLGTARLLGYKVGARPRRHAGTRLELDLGLPVPVLHAYGTGGSGWTLAPGLAEAAVELLSKEVWSSSIAH